MDEYETETTEVAETVTDSKTPILVLGLAAVGAVTVGKKAFDKVRSYRVIRKSKLDALKTPPVES